MKLLGNYCRNSNVRHSITVGVVGKSMSLCLREQKFRGYCAANLLPHIVLFCRISKHGQKQRDKQFEAIKSVLCGQHAWRDKVSEKIRCLMNTEI